MWPVISLLELVYCNSGNPLTRMGPIGSANALIMQGDGLRVLPSLLEAPKHRVYMCPCCAVSRGRRGQFGSCNNFQKEGLLNGAHIACVRTTL